jgi:hypothetical protein
MAESTGGSESQPPAHIQPDELDALQAAPEHHALLFEDDWVRVLDTRIRPGEATAVHTHCWPSQLDVLSWSGFVRRDATGETTLDSRTIPQLRTPPVTVWSEPLPPHSLENVGTADIDIVSVELKQTVPT